VIPAITGKGVPGALTASQLDTELAMWVLSGLQAAIDPRYRLGAMSFPAQVKGGLYPAERDWSEIQAKRGNPSMMEIIEGAQPAAKVVPLQITHKPEENVNVGTGPHAA
jgi:hypothetical protein